MSWRNAFSRFSSVGTGNFVFTDWGSIDIDSSELTESVSWLGSSSKHGGPLWTGLRGILGSLSNHDDDGNKNPINLHIWQWKTVFLHALHVHITSFDNLKTFSFFLRREMTCFAVVWMTSAYDDKWDVTNIGNGERGTGNRSLGTNVQRQPAWEFKMAVKTKERLEEKQFG